MRLLLLLSDLFLIPIDLKAHRFSYILPEILEFDLVNIPLIKRRAHDMLILMHRRHVCGGIEQRHLPVLVCLLVVTCLIYDLMYSFSVV